MTVVFLPGTVKALPGTAEAKRSNHGEGVPQGGGGPSRNDQVSKAYVGTVDGPLVGVGLGPR